MSHRFSLQLRITLILILVGSLSGPLAYGQDYFGRNKVRYQKFDFKVMKTEHFDIYYYEEERQAVTEAARMAERWYVRLSQVLQHELTSRQPLILYGSHPAFRQTTAIPGTIGESTGGVTEALKRRVVLPMAGPMGETDHVLGHEIVHAFQYDMTGQGQTGIGFEAPGALRLPLWFIEGMAEYLSVGPIDSLTAMWMRDGVRQEKLPTIEDLEDPRFFPYRYGQALWSYIGGRFGDQVIGKILRSAGRTGDARGAMQRVLGVEIKELNEGWHSATKAAYEPVLDATAPPTDFGHALFSKKRESGDLNVSPSISPDGKWVIFFSEKGLFSIDIYLADADTGQIRRKITETALDPHFESLQFINSAGAWSPDSRQVAIGAISQGRPILSIIDVQDADTTKEIRFPDLGEIFNPTWSPDGRQIAFSAIKGGIMDLYVVDLQTEKTRQLTDDIFAEIHPDWSPDGEHIAIATDRFSSDLGELEFGEMNLALVDVATGEVQPLPAMRGGRQTNPQWGRDNSTLYFVSDHNGVSNVYVYRMDGRPAQQLTNLQTGASGIAKLSPALTVASGTGRALFSSFEGGDYHLYVLDETKSAARQFAESLPGNPALLPPGQRTAQTVATFLESPQKGLPRTKNFQIDKYDPDLSLDYVAQPTVGVGVSNLGSFVGGGTALQWSDMLGFHNVTTIFEAGNNGGGKVLNSVTGLLGYESQRGRWNWGAIGGQVPFMTGDYLQGATVVDGQEVLVEQQVRYWQINREIQGTLSYPFNEAQRLEFNGGFRNISFDAEAQTDYFSPFTGEFLGRQREDIETPKGINLGTASAALVYDTSVFGGTSPVMGQRYRFELEQVGGNLLFSNVLADYRRYFMLLRPLTLAGRLMHYGRYGSDSEDARLQDEYVGYPSLIRGYDFGSFNVNECQPVTPGDGSCPVFDQLIGSRLAVANLELRMALFGPLGLIPSQGFIPIETAAFYDAAMAWTSRAGADFGSRDPVRSYGGSLRINLLGFVVAQISLVRPLDRPLKNWLWEFSLTPGF
ncbi:MAG: peptidase S9 [Acidobacteria bacterium]|nr:MAG: peptidase S9 [Acidobacteriota bacterium]